jgi:hypothetical protein
MASYSTFGAFARLNHSPVCLFHPQPPTADVHEDTTATSQYNAWQICLITAVASVALNQAVWYVPRLLKFLILAVWHSARGIPMAGVGINAQML